jgi:2Fe-2S ferredoxin
MTSEFIPDPDERGGDEILPPEEVDRRPKVALTFTDLGRTVDACAGESVLQAALRHDIDLEHNCGGWCACTTCHVIVEEGMEHLTDLEDDEEDRLDQAKGLTLKSRLACQTVLTGEGPISVRMGPKA